MLLQSKIRTLLSTMYQLTADGKDLSEAESARLATSPALSFRGSCENANSPLCVLRHLARGVVGLILNGGEPRELLCRASHAYTTRTNLRQSLNSWMLTGRLLPRLF